MFGLPKSTKVDKRISKDLIYQNTNASNKLRNMIKDQIKAIIWRNKLSDNLIGVGLGEDIEELQVIEIQVRQRRIDKRILNAISKAIPYKILFILSFEQDHQAWILASDTFYTTEWIQADYMTLNFEGINLDYIYDNLVYQISNGRLHPDIDLNKAVEIDKKRIKLEWEITKLEKRMHNEKQFNKQVELNQQIRDLQKSLRNLMENSGND